MIAEQIIEFIKMELNADSDLEVLQDEDLLGSGLVESMGMMRLMHFIEKTFDLTVAPTDMTIENFITVDAMVSFINRSKEQMK